MPEGWQGLSFLACSNGRIVITEVPKSCFSSASFAASGARPQVAGVSRGDEIVTINGATPQELAEQVTSGGGPLHECARAEPPHNVGDIGKFGSPPCPSCDFHRLHRAQGLGVALTLWIRAVKHRVPVVFGIRPGPAFDAESASGCGGGSEAASDGEHSSWSVVDLAASSSTASVMQELRTLNNVSRKGNRLWKTEEEEEQSQAAMTKRKADQGPEVDPAERVLRIPLPGHFMRRFGGKMEAGGEGDEDSEDEDDSPVLEGSKRSPSSSSRPHTELAEAGANGKRSWGSGWPDDADRHWQDSDHTASSWWMSSDDSAKRSNWDWSGGDDDDSGAANRRRGRADGSATEEDTRATRTTSAADARPRSLLNKLAKAIAAAEGKAPSEDGWAASGPSTSHRSGAAPQAESSERPAGRQPQPRSFDEPPSKARRSRSRSPRGGRGERLAAESRALSPEASGRAPPRERHIHKGTPGRLLPPLRAPLGFANMDRKVNGHSTP